MSVILHDPTTANPTPPPRSTCPRWCTDPHTDEPFVDSDSSTLVVHRWTVDGAGYRLQVQQCDHTEPDGSVISCMVEVAVDSDAVSVEDAHLLCAALAQAAELAGGAR